MLRSISVLLLLALAGVAEAQPRVERPTWQVGDRWVRSDGAWDLVRIENDRYVFSNGPGSEMHFTRNLALVQYTRAPRGFAFEPAIDLQWPLKVGQFASGDVRWTTRNCPGGCPRRITVRVDKYETITVPAGTFKAFKISLESAPPPAARHNHPGGWTSSIVMWYAPDLGRYVKMENERDWGGRGNPGFTAVLLDVDRPAPLSIAVAGLGPEARSESATLAFSGKVTADKGVRRVTVTLNGAEVLAVDGASNPAREVPLSASLALRPGRNVVLVTATDAGGRGVSRVTVALNGVEVARQDEKTPLRALALNLPIKLREGQNTLVVTATDADGFVQQDVRAVEYARPTPLAIGVRFPEDRARLTDESSVVAAVVTSGKGVAYVNVMLNGAEVARQRTEKSPPTSLVVTTPITLRTGTNAIVISATDGAGITHQEVRTVT